MNDIQSTYEEDMETKAIKNWKIGLPDNRMVPQKQWRDAVDLASRHSMENDALRDQVSALARENAALKKSITPVPQ